MKHWTVEANDRGEYVVKVCRCVVQVVFQDAPDRSPFIRILRDRYPHPGGSAAHDIAQYTQKKTVAADPSAKSKTSQIMKHSVGKVCAVLFIGSYIFLSDTPSAGKIPTSISHRYQQPGQESI